MKIGVHDYEKKGAQLVIVNIDLYVPFEVNTPNHDELDEVLDYNFMRQSIQDIVAEDNHIHLLETLCDMIVEKLLSHPLVQATRVSTEKPDIFPDCESVGVEVFRSK